MTNAVLDAPAEATDDKAVEASLEETKGTTADDVTVQAGDTEQETNPDSDGSAHSADGEDATELKHSDASLAAERESADRDGYQRAVKELSDLRTQRDTRLLELVKAEKADDVAVVRAMRIKANEAGLSDEEAEPILAVGKQAMSVHLEAMGALIAEQYTAEINQLFATPAERKAFWEEAAGLDPTLQVGEVMRLAIEKKSLSTKAIKDADPETLLKANSKLKAYFEHEKDAAKRTGRELGRRDPAGDRSGSGTTVPAKLTLEQIDKMPTSEWMSKPKEERERLLSEARS